MLLARRKACESKRKILEGGLKDIEKHIRSRKTKFQGGSRGLQSYHAQAIESYLRLVVHNGYKGIPASEAVWICKEVGWSTGQAQGANMAESNKWAVDPKKLQEFTNKTMLPAEDAKYCQQICDKEMPQGLKKYLELELFPRIHMKVGKGISMSMARPWLQNEGFKYTLHKKA